MAKKINTGIDKNSVGLASELLVAARLIENGYQVSLTLGHTKSVDIHASKNGDNYSIQVKGAQKNKAKSKVCSWRIESNAIQNNVIYIFVNLNLDGQNNLEKIYILKGIDLQNLIQGRPPQEYVYSSKLGSYLDKWSVI